MEIRNILILLLIMIVTQISLVDSHELCSSILPCNCHFIKRYDETLDIPCINSTCTWSHLINNISMPIEDRFLASANGISLPGNFDPRSYGTFVAKFSGDDSCSYLVVPPLSPTEGYCDNCTGIKVDGNIRGSNEIVYKNFGDDLIIEADFPRVFGVCSFLARLNGSAARLQDHCEVQIDTLTCNCNHLTTNNTGVYVIHITVDTRVNKSTPEWCSNNVTIIVQTITVAFEQAVYNVSENSTAQLMLILSKPLPSNFTLEVHNINGTAFGGVNYAPGPYNVTFPANYTRVSLNVTIIDDDIPEDNKMFTLTINQSSLPRHIIAGNPDQATVTIVDDDDNGNIPRPSDVGAIVGGSIGGLIVFITLIAIIVAAVVTC